jgi:methylthioribulose-1-phosphate dehydratase
LEERNRRERIAAHDASAARAIADVTYLARHAGVMGWVPATSGNFSARVDERRCAVTATGGFKGETTDDRVILVNIGGIGSARPVGLSAEGPLHLQLYRDNPWIGAAAHVHTHASTLLSRRHAHAGYIELSGWELLKAFPGVSTHEVSLRVAIFDNDQDVERLARLVHKRLPEYPDVPGYLIAGHGLYTWGANVQDTRRHLEAFESLLNLQLEQERYS